MPDEPESIFLLWLTYSCDGEGVEDQSTFDLEKGITTIQLAQSFLEFSTLIIFLNNIFKFCFSPKVDVVGGECDRDTHCVPPKICENGNCILS